MNPYSHLADDYYLNLNLTTEMSLPKGREPVLHYFEQVQKKYPQMRNFSTRDKDSFLLEEDKDRGDYSWASVEPRRLCSGQVNPATPEVALDQHRHILELAPYALSLSPLDCEALDVFMGFDFSYRGNQNQLLAETLGVSPALEKLAGIPGSKLIHHEPSITVALDEDCRLQCRVVLNRGPQSTKFAAASIRTTNSASTSPPGTMGAWKRASVMSKCSTACGRFVRRWWITMRLKKFCSRCRGQFRWGISARPRAYTSLFTQQALHALDEPIHGKRLAHVIIHAKHFCVGLVPVALVGSDHDDALFLFA